MAGHSQFKNIMHRKGRQDAQKSKLFGKLAREITVAALASTGLATGFGSRFANRPKGIGSLKS